MPAVVARTRTASVCVRFPDTNRSSSESPARRGRHASTAAAPFPSMRQLRRAAPPTAHGRPSTARSQPNHTIFPSASQKTGLCRGICSNEMNVRATSRADLHCHSTASQLSQARGPARARAARVRDAARGGLRAGQAPRDGLRDDHRPRHDRRRACELADRPDVLRLRGADRLLRAASPRRCTSSATASRPDDHDWLQAHAGDVEAVRRVPARAARSPARSRTRSTPSRRR